MSYQYYNNEFKFRIMKSVFDFQFICLHYVNYMHYNLQM